MTYRRDKERKYCNQNFFRDWEELGYLEANSYGIYESEPEPADGL